MTLTQDNMVPTPAEPGRAPSKRHRWWAVPLAVVGGTAILVPIVFAVLPTTLFLTIRHCEQLGPDQSCAKYGPTRAVEDALVPADAQPVEPRLHVTGLTTYPSSGQIYFVTIREPKISMLDWLALRSNPAARFMSHIDKYGNQTEQQLEEAGARQMTSAKDFATYVALKAAGFPVSEKDGAVIVDHVIECLKVDPSGKCVQRPPAAEVLQENDVITAVNGTPTPTINELQPILAKVKVGDFVDIQMTRKGKKITGHVQTIRAPNESAPRTIIGFVPVDTRTVSLPSGLKVDFDTEGIGGPSAGTAFALTLIDQVTKGSLMGPQKVAVTGEIDVDGNVLPIGGLNSKASAVKQAGVKYFLVPAAQGDDPKNPDSIAAARKVVGSSVQIIPVSTLDEALKVLAQLGGDALPPSTSSTAPPTTG